MKKTKLAEAVEATPRVQASKKAAAAQNLEIELEHAKLRRRVKIQTADGVRELTHKELLLLLARRAAVESDVQEGKRPRYKTCAWPECVLLIPVRGGQAYKRCAAHRLEKARKHMRAWRAKNRERSREIRRNHYAKDLKKSREDGRKVAKALRLKNPERFREKRRARYARDLEKSRKQLRDQYAKNREKVNARSRAKYAKACENGTAWHMKNREKANAQLRAWRAANPEKVREQRERARAKKKENKP